MIGVKITVLLTVVTIIYVYIARSMLEDESIEVKIKTLDNVYPKYVIFGGILILIDFIGIIYSVIYLLFFMKW